MAYTKEESNLISHVGDVGVAHASTAKLRKLLRLWRGKSIMRVRLNRIYAELTRRRRLQ